MNFTRLDRLAVLVCLFATVPLLDGQEGSSREVAKSKHSVAGSVVDSQGRAIAAAQVTLSGPPSDSRRETTSDQSGRFAFPNVPDGPYQIVVSANGFQSLTKSIDPACEAYAALTLVLEIAPTSTTVTVQSGREGITTASADTGSLTPIRLMDLPQSVQIVNREMLDNRRYSNTPTPSRIWRAFSGLLQTSPEALATK